tara:strand:+ start:5537 stop:6931 length:1395 start_codon:yes stop_codon:yes gene_type:complete
MKIFRKAIPTIKKLKTGGTSLLLFDGKKDYAYQASLEDVQTALNAFAPVAESGSGGGWLIPETAFIQPGVTGGTVGDGNAPFPTHTAAIAAGANSFILLPGNYSEQFDLVSGASYYSYEGVTFVAGGITATTDQAGTKWLGNADFIGAFEMIYFNSSVDLVDVEIEFNEIEETAGAARGLTLKAGNFDTGLNVPANLSSVSVKGKKFTGVGGNGYGLSVRGRLGGTIHIDEIYGDYSVISSYEHEDATLLISFNKLAVRNVGSAGNLAQYKQAFISYNSYATSNITLRGDIYNEVVSLMASNGATVTAWTGNLGTVTIEGDIYALNNRGILCTAGTIVHNGNLKSLDRAYVIDGAGKIDAVNSVVEQGKTCTIGGTGELSIINSTIKSTAVDHIIDVVTSTAVVRITNSILEGTSGVCVEHNATTPTIAFQGNVSSNLANSSFTDACSPTGFTQQTGLVAPSVV